MRAMECKKERIFKNIYVAVNMKTKKILSMMMVTDEHVHDSKAMPGLIENIIKSIALRRRRRPQENYLLMMVPMKTMRFLDIYRR